MLAGNNFLITGSSGGEIYKLNLENNQREHLYSASGGVKGMFLHNNEYVIAGYSNGQVVKASIE